MLEMMDMIESIPEDERDQAIRKLFLYSMLGGDYEDFESNAEGADDEDDMYGDEFVYQYFLPRPDVRKYTLRVTLKGLKPAIYRKFNVPSNISLRHLSELLLELMGWSNEHLNQFRKGNGYYAPAYQREEEDDFMMGFGNHGILLRLWNHRSSMKQKMAGMVRMVVKPWMNTKLRLLKILPKHPSPTASVTSRRILST